MTMRRQFGAAILLVGFLALDLQADEGGPPKVRLDLSLYPYQRTIENDTDFTTTLNVSLPGRFSYFGYGNFRGSVTDGNAKFVRSEQNLRFSIAERLPLDLSFQGVLVPGDGNDFYQLGLGWRVHDTPGLRNLFKRLKLVYRFTAQLRRFDFHDSDAWQVEHFFRTNLTERIYLSGFVDQTFELDTSGPLPKTPIVVEIQLGLRFYNQFHAIAEYRKNEFRTGNEENLAVGIEYKFRW